MGRAQRLLVSARHLARAAYWRDLVIRASDTRAILNEILRSLFALQIQGGYIISSTWIPTDENDLADALAECPELRRSDRTIWHGSHMAERSGNPNTCT